MKDECRIMYRVCIMAPTAVLKDGRILSRMDTGFCSMLTGMVLWLLLKLLKGLL